jgi:predicted phage baseplate assembly protein
MIQALPRASVILEGDDGAVRPLQALTTRALDDGTIALIDAWAAALDVLTFYQERILTEGYLSTAVEQRSVDALARVIGYVPAPGVAASTRLAFTIDPTAPAQPVAVRKALPVMSVPGQDELPQTFETTAALDARSEWNQLTPVRTRPHPVVAGTATLYLRGVGTRLAVGAPIVVVGRERTTDDLGSESWDLRFVAALEPVAAGNYTLVTLDRGLGDGFSVPAATEQRVITFRGRASLFGASAPDIKLMSQEIRDALGSGDARSPGWDGFRMSEDPAVSLQAVDLDRDYAGVVKGSWICLQDRVEVELYGVVKVSPYARTGFSLAGKCTRVFLDSKEHLEDFHRRSTVVHIESEELPVSEAPYLEPVSGASIELDRRIIDMPAGRELIFAGTDADSGEPATEVAVVKAWQTSADGARTVIALDQALAARYVRATLAIHGNVVGATHGSTVTEPLGSGNGAVTHQRFALKGAPLTWVPASSASGAESTLEVRVGGVLWKPVTSLHDQGPAAQVYVMDRDEKGATVIELGDGVHGARLPTGANNVSAVYRKGLGLAGEVDAGQLSLLQQRPLGVRAVTNPTAAGGAADPEGLEDTRLNAPLGVLTLDRLVALQDYEDFARAFAGIGKARAVELWDGKRGFVHVTVASASGAELTADAATLTSLVAAMAAYQDPAHVVVVSPHSEIRFGAGLKLLLDPAYTEAVVQTAVLDALGKAFSFSARQFGQAVSAGEVVTVAQNVAGVVAVDLDTLYREDQSPAERDRLTAARAAWTGEDVTWAELLVLDPRLVSIGRMEG